MAERGQRSKLALITDQATEDRLSPAEAHRHIRQRLERLVLSAGLETSDVQDLSRSLYIHSYLPGEIIVPLGVQAGCWGLVVCGQVAVQTGQRRTARTEVVLLPGSAFGERMLTEGQPSPAALQALTDCEIWCLHRDDFKALEAARRRERRTARLHKLGRATIGLTVACLALIVLLSLAPVRRAAALAPMSLGQACAQRGWEGCAEGAWTVAANLAPDDANPQLALGTLYFEQGEIGPAERAFEAARALAPELPEIHNNLGLIYAGQGEHQRAIVSFEKALELEPGVAAVEQNLGLSLQASGACDEALSHYQAALALGEPEAGLLVNVAVAYYETGQPLEAAEAAHAALALDEGLAPAYAVLGAVALDAQQPEEALAYLQRATGLNVEYSEAYFYLGLAYKSLAQPAEAITAFERALATASDELTRVRIRRHLNELYQTEEKDNNS